MMRVARLAACVACGAAGVAVAHVLWFDLAPPDARMFLAGVSAIVLPTIHYTWKLLAALREMTHLDQLTPEQNGRLEAMIRARVVRVYQLIGFYVLAGVAAAVALVLESAAPQAAGGLALVAGGAIGISLAYCLLTVPAGLLEVDAFRARVLREAQERRLRSETVGQMNQDASQPWEHDDKLVTLRPRTPASR